MRQQSDPSKAIGRADAPCTRCGATPETGQTVGCPECEGIVPPAKESGSVMHLRIRVTDQDREMIERAAKQAQTGSVSRWAELNLVDLARVETSGDRPE